MPCFVLGPGQIHPRTLPPPVGAVDMKLAARLGKKYGFDVVGPRLRCDAQLTTAATG